MPPTLTPRPETPPELAALHQRLAKGWVVIDAEADRARREQHTEFWLSLLASYQRLADRLDPRP
jgi:hypothetical protein